MKKNKSKKYNVLDMKLVISAKKSKRLYKKAWENFLKEAKAIEKETTYPRFENMAYPRFEESGE